MSSDAGIFARPFSEVIGHVETQDASAYVLDGITPKYALWPSSVEDLQEIVRAANADGLSIVPWGGGSQMGLGNVPGGYDAAVELTALAEVLRYEPDDMTVSVQTGCRLADINDMLGDHRQVLPVDTAFPDVATIGGLIAVGASGPRRLGYGPLRDLIIGITVLMPDGTIATAGGQVVKNVTGYDMMRLHHGALGSLGIILSVNLKVIPKPQSERTVLASFESLDAANEAARSVANSQLGVTALVATNPRASEAIEAGIDPGWTVSVRCEAPPSAVVRQAERVAEYVRADAVDLRIEDATEQSESLWLRICQALDQRPNALDSGVRIGCTPSKIGGLTTELQEAFGEEAERVRLTLDYGSGLVYLRLPQSGFPESGLAGHFAKMAGFGDHVTLLTGPTSLKQEVDAFGRRPVGFSVIESLKENFDPKRIMNRGRYVGHL